MYASLIVLHFELTRPKNVKVMTVTVHTAAVIWSSLLGAKLFFYTLNPPIFHVIFFTVKLSCEPKVIGSHVVWDTEVYSEKHKDDFLNHISNVDFKYSTFFSCYLDCFQKKST